MCTFFSVYWRSGITGTDNWPYKWLKHCISKKNLDGSTAGQTFWQTDGQTPPNFSRALLKWTLKFIWSQQMLFFCFPLNAAIYVWFTHFTGYNLQTSHESPFPPQGGESNKMTIVNKICMAKLIGWCLYNKPIQEHPILDSDGNNRLNLLKLIRIQGL